MNATSNDIVYTQSAKEMLQQNLHKRITASDIAARMGIGERTLKRAFRSAMQMGIYQYQLQLRLEKAKEYLLEGNKSVKQIALMVGYKKQSSFTRQFIKHIGISPSAWKKQHRGG